MKLIRPTCLFGAKAHIGVDSKETVVHTVVTSAASMADKHMLADLLYGNEKKVWGDAGYQGQTEAIYVCRRAPGPRHDLAAGEDQGRREPTTKAQEPDQG
jgi:IS5 family transposase